FGRSRSEALRHFVRTQRDVPDEQTALSGACDIIAERWAEDASARAWLLEQARHGHTASKIKRGNKNPDPTFEAYFDRQERIGRVASHRLLAMQRGEAEGVLSVGIQLDDERLVAQLQRRFVHQPRFEFYDDLLRTVEDAYERLLLPATESALLQQLK